jgi:hypothetical protein
VEPVGTGPFKLTGWEIGKWVSFDANRTYFKKRPQATSLVIKRVIDPIIRMNELRRSRINLILETSPGPAKVEKMSRVDIESFLPYAFYQVAINTRLFRNADARKAMSMVLDRASLVPAITNRKQGVVLNYGPFPSDLFARNIPEYVATPVPNLLPQNENEAKALAESGGLTGQNAILLYPDSLASSGPRWPQHRRAAGPHRPEGRGQGTGDQVFKRLVFSEKSFELALIYCDGFDNLYSSLDQWFHSQGKDNISGIADAAWTRFWTNGARRWSPRTVELTLGSTEDCELPRPFSCAPCRRTCIPRLKGVAIATDNPFLSIEDWSIGDKADGSFVFSPHAIHGVLFTVVGPRYSPALPAVHRRAAGKLRRTGQSCPPPALAPGFLHRSSRLQRRTDHHQRGRRDPSLALASLLLLTVVALRLRLRHHRALPRGKHGQLGRGALKRSIGFLASVLAAVPLFVGFWVLANGFGSQAPFLLIAISTILLGGLAWDATRFLMSDMLRQVESTHAAVFTTLGRPLGGLFPPGTFSGYLFSSSLPRHPLSGGKVPAIIRAVTIRRDRLLLFPAWAARSWRPCWPRTRTCSWPPSSSSCA